MNEFRHVCMKDLEGYVRKDSYFSDFTKLEKEEILRNLGGVSIENMLESVVIEDTYENIKSLAKNYQLRLNCTYVINDFRTIYLRDDKVFGLDLHPSEVYLIILTPITNHSFSKRACIKSDKVDTSGWCIEYDFTLEDFGLIKSRGKITYMKDLNNNSAFYDFKNILFFRDKSELNKNGTKTYSQDQYFHTFDDGNGNDNSDNCQNNMIGLDCSDIVCLGVAENNTFEWDTHNITLYDVAKHNKLKMAHDVQFQGITVQCNGTIHNKVISDINSLPVPKSFQLLSINQVCMYIDPQVETLQIKTI